MLIYLTWQSFPETLRTATSQCHRGEEEVPQLLHILHHVITSFTLLFSPNIALRSSKLCLLH